MIATVPNLELARSLVISMTELRLQGRGGVRFPIPQRTQFMHLTLLGVKVFGTICKYPMLPVPNVKHK